VDRVDEELLTSSYFSLNLGWYEEHPRIGARYDAGCCVAAARAGFELIARVVL
jgi:hypothetical protein